jgi:hypothetical protein
VDHRSHQRTSVVERRYREAETAENRDHGS